MRICTKFNDNSLPRIFKSERKNRKLRLRWYSVAYALRCLTYTVWKPSFSQTRSISVSVNPIIQPYRQVNNYPPYYIMVKLRLPRRTARRRRARRTTQKRRKQTARKQHGSFRTKTYVVVPSDDYDEKLRGRVGQIIAFKSASGTAMIRMNGSGKITVHQSKRLKRATEQDIKNDPVAHKLGNKLGARQKRRWDNPYY